MISFLTLFQASVLVGGTVHTMEPGTVPRPAKVFVRDGKIEGLYKPGESLPVLRDARGDLIAIETVDVTGMHVLPGLIDGMVNHDADHDVLYVASGITLVRDQANELSRVLHARTPAVRDLAPGPAMLVAGRVLDGDPPVTTEAVIITSVEDAEDKVPRLIELGIDYFSFHLGLGVSRRGRTAGGRPIEVLKSVADLAHDSGRQVWGPLLPGLTLADAAKAGQDGLFYLDGLLPTGKTWRDLEAGRVKEWIGGVPESPFAVTPAMRLYAHRLEDPGDDAPELSVLGPHYAFQWQSELDLRRNLDWDDYVASGTPVVELQREILAQLAARGQTLIPGSAAPNPWILPGIGYHDELAEWEKAGLERSTILESATVGAANALGVGDQRGRIFPGLVADLIVTRKNPLEDLSTLREPAVVCVRGRVLHRAELDRKVDQLIAEVASIKEAASKPIEIEELVLPEGKLVFSGTVESNAHGQRISGERFAVVEHEDGASSYVGRVITPGSARYARTELEITQKISGNKLIEFDVRVESGGVIHGLEGLRVGGHMRLRQTLEGGGGRNSSVSQVISLIDAGSVTASLIVARHVKPGTFNSLFFEEIDPAVGPWSVGLGEDNTYLVQTPKGGLYFDLEPNGTLETMRRVEGTTVIETKLLELDLHGGEGLVLPEHDE